ncbi:MAG: metalloregulator ArsR/SmtB family transcription factor [Pseudomonadales bacterium]
MARSKFLPGRCAQALTATMRPDLFRALCDPVRISMVATLASRNAPATVSELADCCGIDFSGVSRHLKILKDAGVLSATRDGRKVLYALDAIVLATSLRAIAEALELCQQQAG